MADVKKRKTYTVAYKLEVIRKIENQGNLDGIARELKIDRRCLQRWRVQKPKLLATAQSKKGSRSIRLPDVTKPKQGQFPDLEKKLTEWILQQREKR